MATVSIKVFPRLKVTYNDLLALIFEHFDARLSVILLDFALSNAGRTAYAQ